MGFFQSAESKIRCKYKRNGTIKKKKGIKA